MISFTSSAALPAAGAASVALVRAGEAVAAPTASRAEVKPEVSCPARAVDAAGATKMAASRRGEENS